MLWQGSISRGRWCTGPYPAETAYTTAQPLKERHFLRQAKALEEVAADPKLLADLYALPSFGAAKMLSTTKTRDVKKTKDYNFVSWAATRVCGFGGKDHCIFSPTKCNYSDNINAFQAKLESVSECYLCGDLIFDDSDPLSEVFIQRQNLTCKMPIERAYYNVPERKLKLKDICFHCGETRTNSFLLCQEQLEKRFATEGYKCLPTCVECFDSGKKAAMTGTQDMQKKRKEKEAKAKAVKAAKGKNS